MIENETYKMVQGVMVLMRESWCGTVYMFLGSIVNDGCNSYIVAKGQNKQGMAPIV